MNSQIVSQIIIFYVDTLHEHIHIYCDISISCIISETIMKDQHTEKYYNKREKNTDDQKTLYGDSLDDLAIEILADVISCGLLFCVNTFHHHQIGYTYSFLVESLHVSASPCNKRSQHRDKQIPGWNWYCKDFHVEGRKYFLNWRRSCFPRNIEIF